MPEKTTVIPKKQFPESIKKTICQRLTEEMEKCEKERSRLESLYGKELKNGDFNTSREPADCASFFEEASKYKKEMENIAKRQSKIRLALIRLAAGTYGVCHICGEDIPMLRLEQVPFTEKCIECKSS